MEDQNDTSQPSPWSLTDEQLVERAKVVKTFWDVYQEHGIGLAAAYFEKEVASQPAVARMLIPDILLEARNREINTITFMEDMDEHIGNSDANRIIHDGGRVHTLSDNEAVVDEDQDEAEASRDADGQADGTAECDIEST